MTEFFDPGRGVVIVVAKIFGPSGDAVAELALDTGATTTLINPLKLRAAGYDPELTHDRTYITTGSGIEFVPRLTINRLTALHESIRNLPIICHNLPPSARVDGLLGLDFLRNRRLTLDFRRSTITLT